jgi:hypothetical protein
MGGQFDAVAFVPVTVVVEVEGVTFAAKVLWVSATLETGEAIEVCDVELPETEPREPEWLLEVEIPEFDPVGLVVFAEYTAIPAPSTTTTTIAAIQEVRISYGFLRAASS